MISILVDFFFQFMQHIGDFNYQHLADFGAGISGANKHENQGVLEELDVSSFNLCSKNLDIQNIGVCLILVSSIQVHKRLELTLDLLKKEVEVNKIQVLHHAFTFHISFFCKWLF